MIDPVVLGGWVAERRRAWQLGFLNAKKTHEFARERGVWLSSPLLRSGGDTTLLWRVGLLRADLVMCSDEPPAELAEGLVAVDEEVDGRRSYADARRVRTPEDGWVRSSGGLPDLPQTVRPLFHPFRYRVINSLVHALDLRVTPVSTLTTGGVESYVGMVRRALGSIGRGMDDDGFVEYAERLNDVAALAVAAEPCVAEKVFGRFVSRTYDYSELGIDIDELFELEPGDRWDLLRSHLEAQIAEQRRELASIFREVGQERLEAAREQLLLETNTLDSNRNTHTLLRLTSARERLRLRGALGGALVLNTMAETLRRQTEATLDVTLPEEDEIGPAPKFRSFKEEVYGSVRLLDGEEAPRREFLRYFDLDRNVRLRWYVEGETEAGALERFLEEYNLGYLIQVVNYRGQIRSGRTDAFFADLQRDLSAMVFSYVSVDGDEEDVVRVVRSAAEQDLICGEFFVSNPDFEYANFTPDELEAVA